MTVRDSLTLRSVGAQFPAAAAQFRVAPPPCLPEGVTSLGIGYGAFILDHTPVRGFFDAEVSVDTQSQRRGSATVESLNRMEKACLEAWRVRQSSRMPAIPRLSANTDLGRKLSV